MQMIVKDATGQHWLVDGMIRRPLTAAQVVGLGNDQGHQAGLLGNLGNGGAVWGPVAVVTLDDWGVDLDARDAARDAADQTRDAAVLAAINALAAGGTSVDTAAIIAAINAAAATVQANVKARFAAAGTVA